jgi:hypothetical protein
VTSGSPSGIARLPKNDNSRPPPWSVEEQAACFVVRDHNGQAQDGGAPLAVVTPMTYGRQKRMKCGRGDVLKAVLDALREELRKHDSC